MNLRSGFKKGRNSNILGSISMINMRSMSRWSTPQLLSFFFLKKSAGNCLARSSIVLLGHLHGVSFALLQVFFSLFFFRSEWQSLLTEELFDLEHFAMSFRLQEKFVERCFQ
jgi:hypothetical protein